MRTEAKDSRTDCSTRVRDPVHDYVWPPLCKRHKGQYQTCPRDVVRRVSLSISSTHYVPNRYIREHMEVAYWAIFLQSVGYMQCFFTVNMVGISFVECCFIFCLLFPMSNLTTSESGMSNAIYLCGDGGCGDLLFSGHSTLVMTGIIYLDMMLLSCSHRLVHIGYFVGLHELLRVWRKCITR